MQLTIQNLSKIISYQSEISQKSAKKTVEIKVVAVINSDFLERKHLKMVIWTVLDSLNLILDRAGGSGLTALHQRL